MIGRLLKSAIVAALLFGSAYHAGFAWLYLWLLVVVPLVTAVLDILYRPVALLGVLLAAAIWLTPMFPQQASFALSVMDNLRAARPEQPAAAGRVAFGGEAAGAHQEEGLESKLEELSRICAKGLLDETECRAKRTQLLDAWLKR